jgi:hypothetical protein
LTVDFAPQVHLPKREKKKNFVMRVTQSTNRSQQCTIWFRGFPKPQNHIAVQSRISANLRRFLAGRQVRVTVLTVDSKFWP